MRYRLFHSCLVLLLSTAMSGCTGWRSNKVTNYDDEGNPTDGAQLTWQPGRKDQKDVGADFDPNLTLPAQ